MRAVFKAVRTLLDDEEHWCKGWARKGDDSPCGELDPRAVQWSLSAALHKELEPYPQTKLNERWYWLMYDAIDRYTGRTIASVSFWNDDKATLHWDVTRALDIAIKMIDRLSFLENPIPVE